MTQVVYISKADVPIAQETFEFLLGFIRNEKVKSILKQKIKQNADEMLIGEILAMVAIKKTFDIPVSLQKITVDSCGKPYLKNFPQVFFNISHSEGYIACAVCDSPVGIDIQKITPFNYVVAKKICTEEELSQILNSPDQDSEFTKLWTKKEAVLKMKGTGITNSDIKNCLIGSQTKSTAINDFWLTISAAQ